MYVSLKYIANADPPLLMCGGVSNGGVLVHTPELFELADRVCQLAAAKPHEATNNNSHEARMALRAQLVDLIEHAHAAAQALIDCDAPATATELPSGPGSAHGSPVSSAVASSGEEVAP